MASSYLYWVFPRRLYENVIYQSLPFTRCRVPALCNVGVLRLVSHLPQGHWPGHSSPSLSVTSRCLQGSCLETCNLSFFHLYFYWDLWLTLFRISIVALLDLYPLSFCQLDFPVR